MNEGRPPAFYWLAAFFGCFVLFLYGPMIVIFILSFQGPDGGLTFPLNGLSLHWFERLWQRRRHRRHQRRFQALAAARRRRDGADGRALAVGRPRLSQALRRLEPAVLRRGREPDRALDRHLARHRPGVSPARRLRSRRYGPSWIADELTTTMGHVHLRAGRASHLDAAVRPARDVRDLQPLRSSLRGSRARPRRDALADLRYVDPADHPALGHRRRPVRLHACPGTRSRAPARRSANTTRCRWSCRR